LNLGRLFLKSSRHPLKPVPGVFFPFFFPVSFQTPLLFFLFWSTPFVSPPPARWIRHWLQWDAPLYPFFDVCFLPPYPSLFLLSPFTVGFTPSSSADREFSPLLELGANPRLRQGSLFSVPNSFPPLPDPSYFF